MTCDFWLVGVAWRLDRLRWQPRSDLVQLVHRDGLCMWDWFEDEPVWRDEYLTDRELAARLCSGCPVQDECLELELRTAGPGTVGVWGAMSEDDRRALYSHWRQRGERAEGGPTP